MILKGVLTPVAKDKKRQIAFCIFAVLAIFLMVIIFSFSAQEADESEQVQYDVNDFINRILDKITANMSEENQIEIKNTISTYLRKIAHVTLYTALGFSLFGAALSAERPKKLLKKGGAALLVGGIYAATDETHQLFVEGRSGEIRDVLLDSAGVLLGILIMLAAYKIIKFWQKRRKLSLALEKE